MSGVTALSLSGRLNVIVAMWSSTSYRIVSYASDIIDLSSTFEFRIGA